MKEISREKIKNLLDKSDISVKDEIYILEYIDFLVETLSENSIKNKRLENIILKSKNYLKDTACYEEDTKVFCDDLCYYECSNMLDILNDKERYIIDELDIGG